MTLCCSNCFHDSAIIRTIGLNHTNDRCGYCKKENAFTINPKDLSRFFEPFLGIVVESEKGELLSDILQNTFNIFNEKIHNTKKLLGEILGNEYIIKKYLLKEDYLDHISKWESPLQEMLQQACANPIGISYLYLANNEETCISEVRPNNTSIIYISKLILEEDVSLIDLTSPRKKISICSFDEKKYNNVISILNLLEMLSSELSKPVRPESSNIDYIPTQFLCEFLKSFSNCDGIIFESSFGMGKNFVFYDDLCFTIEEPISYKITEIVHSFEKITT